jgi:mannose-1-phosphate guanylyltransferase/mannose-6-phosphate isomerase
VKIVPVILAGGIGERFWPLSRSSRPKQLLPIISSRTMMEETMARAKPFCKAGVSPLVVTGSAIAGQMRRVLPKTVRYDCIAEIAGRNTAPAIAAAAVWLTQKHKDAIMAVLPADHAVRPASAFVDAVRFAAQLAEKSDCLCVFGIKPSRPDTGYGYIQTALPAKSGIKKAKQVSFAVRRFVEKPSVETAKEYCASGDYFWNSGMFVWKASVILREIEIHMPQLFCHVKKLASGSLTKERINRFYRECPAESIDFGVMEKAKHVVMVCPEYSWDDVGSWEALERIYGPNIRGTTVTGPSIFDGDCAGSIIVNKSSLNLAVCGLNNVVVVATDDAVLVIDRAKLPEVKKYLAAIKKSGVMPETLF